MLQPMNRRRFLQGLGAGAFILSRAAPTRAATQGDRLVVAVGQWGIETPFAWRSSQSEKRCCTPKPGKLDLVFQWRNAI
jgi:hypothetical protein